MTVRCSTRARARPWCRSCGVSSYQIAEVLAWQGNAAGAFKWLEKAYQEHDPGLNYLKFDPLLRKVRGQPRFAALLRKMNLPPD